jgi:alkylation response protein AidB-like acyl-CoA dehydrogenase
MRFDLDEQQLAFQQSVHDYLSAECPVQRTLAPHDTGDEDLGLWRGLMALGIGALTVPEAHGGLGLGLLDLAVVSEVVGRHAMPGPFVDHALATLAVALAGSEAQKARWLPSLASGEKRATVALSEGEGRWDADTWALPASKTLTGSKHHVLHARGADVIVVGLQGGRLGLVHAEDGSAGVDIVPVPCIDAGRQMAQVRFEATPCELMPQAVAQRVVDAGLVLLAADAYGGASRCVDMAVDYAKVRVQFGQPIGAFQALKHQLANMALAVQPSMGLYWYAGHAFDAVPQEAGLAAVLAKSQLCEAYPKVARQAIEAHGGIGYTWEFGLHVWLKRALFDQAWLGMPQALRARAAGLQAW